MQKIGTTASVLDNKETFLQFSTNNAGEYSQVSNFIRVNYRHRNLQLANALDRTISAWGETVNKTIRSLRFCSSISIIEKEVDGTGKIIRSSKTCKNPHCAICSRARSNRLALRLSAAIEDPENKRIFDRRYFYFLTLTVKHNEGTRTGIYLREFNSYCNKLFRSKVWRTHFPYSKDKPNSGWIHCRECTINETGYHIHAHILITAPRIKTKISEVEKEIRRKWIKITGDSHQIKLDLIKKPHLQKEAIQANEKIPAVKKAIRELFKYGTKEGKIRSWNSKIAELYGEWIEATKGANFVNISGSLRGLGLSSCKCKYDTKFEKPEFKSSGNYYIGKTSHIHFTKPAWINYSTRKRKEILPSIALSCLPSKFYNISKSPKTIAEYLNVGLDEKEVLNFIPEWMQANASELNGENSEKTEKEPKKEKTNQIEMFKIHDLSKEEKEMLESKKWQSMSGW